MAKKDTMSVLLIITGSIAAVKSLELIKQLREKKIDVDCVLTSSAQEFVTPLAVASYLGKEPFLDMFSLTDEVKMGHIELSRKHDVVLVAPASADFLAKMTHGFANDLASTVILASNKPVMVAPAMNHMMWEHPATQRNVKQLKKDGVTFVGPEKGELACGEFGMGRMADVTDIVAAILKKMGVVPSDKELYQPLKGRRALVTSGPTVEAIDPVRFISNRSSGKQGHAIAECLAAHGAEVILVSGPTQRPDPVGVQTLHVESAKEMYELCHAKLPVDIAICTAAVADWGVQSFSQQKIKKQGGKPEFTLKFAENPDILASLSQLTQQRPELVIGFAAESEFVEENALVKLEKKRCDWIVANDISEGKVFESDENTVSIISTKGTEQWPCLDKKMVAERLVARIISHFNGNDEQKIRLVKV